jgi:hypothetical protein
MLTKLKKAPTQYFLIALMLLCYGLFLIEGTFIFAALLLQLVVGILQLVQASVIAKRHHSDWHKNYITVVLGYIFVLLVGYFIVFKMENPMAATIFMTVLVCLLPCLAALYYARRHYQTYL